MINEDEVRSRYIAAGQEQVLKYLHVLPEAERCHLLEQLSSIEVEKLSTFLDAALAEQKKAELVDEIKPFSKEVARTIDCSQYLIKKWYDTGIQAVKRGEVAALVLAGGQGTRLGFDGPKGLYDIGLPSGSTLFRMISERIYSLTRLASVAEGTTAGIPFYIMTSPLNHDETVSYFKKNSNFGLPDDGVRFFQQGMLPCLTNEGKIIMETQGNVAMAPDGNGGVYPSLLKSGMLEDMTNRGVKYLHVFSIDNALVKPADPVFIGYCISQGADCGNKVIWKAHAHEKVGVVAEKDDKPCIVEYSDITSEMAERTDDNRRLVFGAANICNHFYTLDFINDVIIPNLGNMYHVAKKKIPYYDEVTKKTISPAADNGMKLESFIFDVFPLSRLMAIIDVARSEEFAPVKNAPGSTSDSPETAQLMISELSKKWVLEAGGTLVGETDSICEVSPLLSYAGESMEELRGKEIRCPFLLGAPM